jgi:phosphatidylinositol-3-phosphatase
MMISRTSLPPAAVRRPRLPLGFRLGIVVAVAAAVASAAMTVSAATPKVTAPAAALPGATITVTGSGYHAGQTGNLTYNGAVVTKFTASSSGAISVAFKIPSTAKLNTTGRISAKKSDGRLLATTTLRIGAVPATARPSAPNPARVAALSVPATARPGDTIAVNGAGFAAGQTGIVTLNGVKVATFGASSGGTFSVPFTIPTTNVMTDSRISAKKSDGSLLATTTITLGVTGNPLGYPSASPSASDSASPSASDPAAAGAVPNFDHIYDIWFENKEYTSVVGSSKAPYINSLIDKYGLATAVYAERHPSEPNYIAQTSGSTQGVTDDGNYNLGVNNLFDQIEASGRTWRSVQQGYPGKCFTGSSSSSVVDGAGKSGGYVRKHNPAISYTSISGNAAKCANITNLASFDPAAADFQFITPNMINDMHDGSVADGDNFLKAFLPQILNSAAFANSLVIVTFDEGTTNTNGGGHIMTIMITPNMTPGFKATATYDHYSMLRTIEDAWNLPCLGNACSATDMAFPW